MAGGGSSKGNLHLSQECAWPLPQGCQRGSPGKKLLQTAPLWLGREQDYVGEADEPGRGGQDRVREPGHRPRGSMGY